MKILNKINKTSIKILGETNVIHNSYYKNHRNMITNFGGGVIYKYSVHTIYYKYLDEKFLYMVLV